MWLLCRVAIQLKLWSKTLFHAQAYYNYVCLKLQPSMLYQSISLHIWRWMLHLRHWLAHLHHIVWKGHVWHRRLVKAHLIGTIVLEESLAKVCLKLHIVEHLCYLHGSLHFATTLRLLALSTDLQELRGKLVGPYLSLTCDEWLIILWQHLHVLLDAKKRVFDGSLLNESEEHSRYVSLPRDLIVLLKHLKAQVAPILGWTSGCC